MALGRKLTDGQRRATEAIATSGRGLDVVVGVAGSGKTTALEVLRSAFEEEGFRVLGTAISGQAARTLHAEAGVESRTIASLIWRLEHRTLTLDRGTVLLIDEAGMADDQAMLKPLAAVDVAGAKAVVIGDHLQLGAVEPGGGLEALVNRHNPAVHVLDENIRQRDPGERAALAQLRSRDIGEAVDWYCRNDRIVVRPRSWTRPAGASPARVIAGEPGSRSRFVAERRRAERGVKSLFGGSKRAGRSATRRESCSLVRLTTGEPSRSCHGEGHVRPTGVPDTPLVGSPRGTGSGTYARSGSEGERLVCAASSAKTARISQW